MPRWHKDSAGNHRSNLGCAPDRMFTSLFQSSEESGAEPPDQAASGLALTATPTPTKTSVPTPESTDAPVSSPTSISRPTLTPASTAVNTPTTKPTPTSALAPAYPINMGLDADSLWREAFDSFDPFEQACISGGPLHEGRTIRRIRDAVRHGDVEEPFSPQRVSAVLAINWSGIFLPKHRVGNPGGDTEFFVRVSSRSALYRLAPSPRPGE